MARLPRPALPAYPHHVMQRSHAGQALAYDDADREALVATLHEAAQRHPVDVHAYVVLDDRFRLVATPRSAEGLSLLMQDVGRRYVARFNRRHGRSGSLWAERYRACVLDPAQYLLPAMIDVETHPSRAALAVEPASYRWSSCAHHLGQRIDPLITEPAAFWSLGNTPFDREAAWRRLLAEGCSAAQLEAIEAATAGGWALGPPAFVATCQGETTRPLQPRPRGRPRKAI